MPANRPGRLTERHCSTSANAGPDPDYSLEGGEIYSIPLAGGPAKQLTSRKGPDQSPVVSPDGNHVAYLGFDFHLQSYSVTHLYVMNPDGSNPRRLATDVDRDIRSPQWSRDGKGLYAVIEDKGTAHIHYIGLDGS